MNLLFRMVFNSLFFAVLGILLGLVAISHPGELTSKHSMMSSTASWCAFACFWKHSPRKPHSMACCLLPPVQNALFPLDSSVLLPLPLLLLQYPTTLLLQTYSMEERNLICDKSLAFR